VVLSEGVGNIIGTHDISFPEITARCFAAIFSCISAGLEVGQAVVEARKKLQSHTENSDFTNHQKPFQYWSLPVQYGSQKISFFTIPLSMSEVYESENYNNLRQRLFGFKDDLLPPKALVASDRQFHSVLALLRNELPIYLSGGEGCGKTSLGHQIGFYLTHLGEFKFSFYFDFSPEFYSKEDVLQMINPILSPEATDSTPCLFLFDNLDLISTENIDDIEKESLSVFIYDLQKQGHKIITSGQPLQGMLSSYQEIEVKNPTPMEQQHHISLLLGKHGLNKTSMDKEMLDLFQALKGNPFLLEKTIPLFEKQTTAEVSAEIIEAFNLDSDNNSVGCFFQWQWEKMPIDSQRLFMVLISVPGVLLEMIDVAANKEVKDNPVEALLLLISSDPISFSSAFSSFRDAGLLQQFPHGNVISTRIIPFVEKLREQNSWYQTHADQLPLLLSKIICSAICNMAPHLQSQAGSPIKQNLLLNRGKWAKHLETVWFALELDVFIRTKGALFALLKQEGLASECADWSYDIISRSIVVLPNDTKSPLEKLAWLNLATDALEKSESEDTPLLDSGVKEWQEWLESNTTNEEVPLRISAVQFLDSYYMKNSNWESCRRVNKYANQFFREKGIWSKFIQSSQTLAHCSHKLGESDQALSYEHEMLELPPFEAQMSGYKDQLKLEIIMTRIMYDLLTEAQCLLDSMDVDEGPMKPAITNLQSDIFFKQERYQDALPLLEQLHSIYSAQGQNDAVEAVQKQINITESKLKASSS